MATSARVGAPGHPEAMRTGFRHRGLAEASWTAACARPGARVGRLLGQTCWPDTVCPAQEELAGMLGDLGQLLDLAELQAPHL